MKQSGRSVRKPMNGVRRSSVERPAASAATVAAIVSVSNEEESIGKVLGQLTRLALDELIIVMNGCRDRSFPLARSYPQAVILHYPHPIGHDVGRAIGAKAAQSDILLFVDGDFPVPAESLAQFIEAVRRGTDVALNDLSPYLPMFDERDAVTRCKEFLNRCLGRPDLGANSLTAVPHALSRKAVETIGCANLMVPPKAHAIALLQGLKVEASVSVNVFHHNRERKINIGTINPVSQLIVGDHLEAFRQAMDIQGGRLLFPDRFRRRAALRRKGR
ncbi:MULTISPECIES: glycosyltransferase [unclassified Paenibacillus]|uniref:glycosyltransferase family 2 protein n=1 Tax=unclassified Paenibacillus TaxID=185978 RepID=UPI001C10B0C4|nr:MULTISPECIES: glycosyltransferase [unclassified Paenibacillus]MBU5440844.1 glycosyltransferase [Paenibacillus sp. MSJ-34]CAH0118457.1 hypothetical protein PAE9249_00946 [Paenibacillus sp. CECT 9249]